MNAFINGTTNRSLSLSLSLKSISKILKNICIFLVLAGVAQWIEPGPANQRVMGSIPSQGTCLGCRPGP